MPRQAASFHFVAGGPWPAVTALMPAPGARATLLAHYLNDDAFIALSVELGVIDLLPWTEIELARGHRHDDLVMHEQALQVGIAVGLASAMVPVVLPKRRELLQPLIDISDQTVLGVI